MSPHPHKIGHREGGCKDRYLKLYDRIATMPSLSNAQGYLDLGMHEDAWAATEDLPPEARTQPAVLELRLRILTSMEKWDLADELARVLWSSDMESHRTTVARFHHAHARALCAEGKVREARRAVRLAVEAWEPVRAEIVEDDGLEAVSTP